ncbi:hypothetical protein C0989_010651 [Termitomyces sp. Mn162]|nr:hypothetical protein C0989_010651 [Termitomyces sp. Mn162]
MSQFVKGYVQSFLEGLKVTLSASRDFEDGHYKSTPERGLRAYGRVYAGWAYGQTVGYYKFMYPDLNSFLREEWEESFAMNWDANDLLTLLETWKSGDISLVRDGGDLQRSLMSIKARGLIMPCKTDLYFPLGGATGRVGDPSGRLTERQLADIKQVSDNVDSLTQGIRSFFKRASAYAESRGMNVEGLIMEPAVTSNLQWHENINLLDFLRTVGVHARVNTMLNRESVKARLTSQRGLSFTEFTYQLLQAYDFYHLHKNHECTIQIGGSDQWGNILAGIELVGRLEDPNSEDIEAKAFGLTTPLLTTASGEKFGKSAGNAVWLDANLTSVFDFYQACASYFVC